MGTSSRSNKLLGVAIPSLAVAGGLSALGYLRYFFQPRRLFLPDRFPDGIWDPAPFGLPAEDAWFHAADDVELHGWWIPHEEARGTVLVCHGHTGSIGHQVGFLRHLRRLRVNLLAFDYRGYGRSAGEPGEEGLYRDVRAAWGYLVEELEQDPREVLLFGHSLGAAVAIDCALDRPAAGLIAQAAFADIRSAARASYPGFPLHWAARNQFRNVEKVARITAPKLFVHGDEDARIPLADARRLYQAAAEPRELYVVEGGGHADLYRQGGGGYLARLGRFRDRCLRGAFPPSSYPG